MQKYDLVPEQLLHEGTISQEQLFAPGDLSEEDILAVHDEAYWIKLREQNLSRPEERRTGFPMSGELVRREKVIARGTIECSLHALKDGISLNIAGGTHHAFSNRGEGFCLLNDIAIGASYLLRNNLANKILVIDLDVHQGNGTAEIFSGNDHVFTFSVHGRKNYPYQKERSNLDIGLDDETGDRQYLEVLENHLPQLFHQIRPDFVFYQAGVDILDSDKLGRLSISKRGCRERDKMVLESCHSRNIPVTTVMGGGYSPHIRDIVEAHANTFRLATEIYA